MPNFEYVAKRGPGEDIAGTVEAPNRRAALDALIEKGYTPVRIREKKDPSQRTVSFRGGRKGIPARQLNLFTRQFASLVRSRIPLLRALRILGEQAEHPALKETLAKMTEAVREGSSLSEAMEKYPRIFSPLYVSLIRSGEVGGMLETVLERLAEGSEREEAMRSKIQTALAYPAFVGLMGVVTVVVLLTFVMPRLLNLLVGLGEDLPAPTRLLLAVTRLASTVWFWGAAVGGFLFLFIGFRLLGEKGREIRDTLLLQIPVFGNLIQKIELSRFFRSFGLLLEHGVPVFRAVEVAAPVLSHRVIRRQLESLPQGLKRGQTLSDSLRPLPLATPFLINTITVGEEGGRLGAAFLEITNFYDRETERLLQIWAALLEPVLILGVGCIVGFIVMAILLPVFEVSTLAY